MKKYSNNKNLLKKLEALKPQLAVAAQEVYDDWDQDEEGIDEHYGSGGICDDIASAFCEVFSEHDIDCTTEYSEYDTHTYSIAYDDDEVYIVDIKPYYYEEGFGFNWRKIPGVVFTPEMISIEDISDLREHVISKKASLITSKEDLIKELKRLSQSKSFREKYFNYILNRYPNLVTRAEISAEILADKKGIPRDSKDFSNIVQEKLQELVDENIDYLLEESFDNFDFIKERRGEVVVHRCITVPDAYSFIADLKSGRYRGNYEGVGVYWSFDEDTAECYYGDPSEDKIILHGTTPWSSIDLQGTLEAITNPYTGLEENELRLKKGSVINLYEVEIPEDKRIKENIKVVANITSNKKVSIAEEVPLDFLLQFMHVDRTKESEGLENIGYLISDIKENGLRQPLLLEIGLSNGRVCLAEGNHRVWALKYLGYEYVPTTVIVSDTVNCGIQYPYIRKNLKVGDKLSPSAAFTKYSMIEDISHIEKDIHKLRPSSDIEDFEHQQDKEYFDYIDSLPDKRDQKILKRLIEVENILEEDFENEMMGRPTLSEKERQDLIQEQINLKTEAMGRNLRLSVIISKYIKKMSGIEKTVEGIGNIDSGIAEYIKRLNEAGYKTSFSCSGMPKDHPEYRDLPEKFCALLGYIVFPKKHLSKQMQENIYKSANSSGLYTDDYIISGEPSIIVRLSDPKRYNNLLQTGMENFLNENTNYVGEISPKQWAVEKYIGDSLKKSDIPSSNEEVNSLWYRFTRKLLSLPKESKIKYGSLNVSELIKLFESRYPLAGKEVSGIKVRKSIPNTSSIESSLNDYYILSGIRKVPMSEFNTELGFVDKYTRKLAEDITKTRELNPLIVVIDSEGPYILEGGHRFDAAILLGLKSIPALVVLDLEDLEEHYEKNKLSRYLYQYPTTRQEKVLKDLALEDSEKLKLVPSPQTLEEVIKRIKIKNLLKGITETNTGESGQIEYSLWGDYGDFGNHTYMYENNTYF